MEPGISPTRLGRLDTQGFDGVDAEFLGRVAPGLRIAFGLCAALAVTGTALASIPLLLILAAVAALAALFPVHPFDLVYNLLIRHVTGTPPLPRRGAPNRFACGLGAVWLLGVVWAFQSSHAAWGYGLGFALAGVAILVSTTDICIPSMIFRAVFGPPTPRT